MRSPIVLFYRKNTQCLWSLVALTLAPMSLSANVVDSAVCLRDEITRIVELRVEGVNGVPCSVNYVKSDESQPDEKLWSAQHDAGHCETNFDQFIAKLEDDQGWSCKLHVPTEAELAEAEDRSRALARAQAQARARAEAEAEAVAVAQVQAEAQDRAEAQARAEARAVAQVRRAQRAQQAQQTQAEDVIAGEETSSRDVDASAVGVARLIDKRAAERRAEIDQ